MVSIAVTGARGFIGSNLAVQLHERGFTVVPVPHEADDLESILYDTDAVAHLAGVNRPRDEAEFATGNGDFTTRLATALKRLGRKLPVVYASSIQAALDNPYGRSKRAAEAALEAYSAETGAPVAIFRLPNVFGKWCRPNYNSVVATFCFNISHGLPISITDPTRMLRLVYVDDVVARFTEVLRDPAAADEVPAVEPVYETSLGALAAQLERFRDSRRTLVTGPVGTGLMRALHATFLSYLDPAEFGYSLTRHTDPRGTFAEMLRTEDAGQFSYFTAHPGITRGGHYHHSKTEKFLVLHGKARFGFRHILTGETYEIVTSGEEARVVETIPGWAHDITNIGEDTMVVMLWANEVFDPDKPDTVAAKVLEA
ncbi:MAG: SDR family oxidoreductase [Rhizobiaceae bacterium]|nr:MAG: SDR family oxidoreductase [Rhizobiaceae bacterium]